MAANQACLTTDNGINIVSATTRRLGWNHLPCFGHNQHLTVGNYSIKDERQALGVFRKIVSNFSHSWKYEEERRKAAEAESTTMLESIFTTVHV